MDIADTIKRALSMNEVARLYGYEPNRAGNILCPFHNEKTASLKIYKEPGRGWHCYGCGAGGSVIDFVMRLYGIPFSAAIVRLNADFHLGLTNSRPDPREAERLQRELREKKRARDAFEAEYRAKTDRHRRLWEAKQTKAPVDPDDPFDPEYAEALIWLPWLEWWFSITPYEQR